MAFYRTDRAHGAETGGVGLGLAIARGIVDAHGGAIQLEDNMPSGLRVRVTLPRSSAR
jgi:signal transduction histidine kinase